MNNKEVKLNYNLGPTLKGGESLLSYNNVIDSVKYVCRLLRLIKSINHKNNLDFLKK